MMEDRKMSKLSLITKGFVKDNPTFVLVLGMCPKWVSPPCLC